MTEPCNCGATDCRKCYPQAFYKGRYMYRACAVCGKEYRMANVEDGWTKCSECKGKEDENGN